MNCITEPRLYGWTKPGRGMRRAGLRGSVHAKSVQGRRTRADDAHGF